MPHPYCPQAGDRSTWTTEDFAPCPAPLPHLPHGETPLPLPVLHMPGASSLTHSYQCLGQLAPGQNQT